MSAHAKLSASGSHRWLTCPASVRVEAKIEQRQSSAFAEEGTLAHALAENCLISDLNATEYANELFEGQQISADMAHYVQGYIDYVRDLGCEQHYEVHVSFKDWVPEGFGTADAIVYCHDTKTLHIVDLKYGKGVIVNPERNSQGMLYALGALAMMRDKKQIDNVEIHIYQPRAGNIASWTCSASDLLEFGSFARKRALLALSDDAPFNPEEKACLFCAAKATCKALSEHVEATILADFDSLDDVPLPEPETLSIDRVAYILTHRKLIADWLSAIEDYVTDQLHQGKDVKGWKLVEGRSIRKWQDSDEVAAKLIELIGEDKTFERKIITPAQAEKLIGKKNLADIANLVSKPQGAPTLAPASDKRPPLAKTSDDFEDIA